MDDERQFTSSTILKISRLLRENTVSLAPPNVKTAKQALSPARPRANESRAVWGSIRQTMERVPAATANRHSAPTRGQRNAR